MSKHYCFSSKLKRQENINQSHKFMQLWRMALNFKPVLSSQKDQKITKNQFSLSTKGIKSKYDSNNQGNNCRKSMLVINKQNKPYLKAKSLKYMKNQLKLLPNESTQKVRQNIKIKQPFYQFKRNISLFQKQKPYKQKQPYKVIDIYSTPHKIINKCRYTAIFNAQKKQRKQKSVIYNQKNTKEIISPIKIMDFGLIIPKFQSKVEKVCNLYLNNPHSLAFDQIIMVLHNDHKYLKHVDQDIIRLCINEGKIQKYNQNVLIRCRNSVIGLQLYGKIRLFQQETQQKLIIRQEWINQTFQDHFFEGQSVNSGAILWIKGFHNIRQKCFREGNKLRWIKLQNGIRKSNIWKKRRL